MRQGRYAALAGLLLAAPGLAQGPGLDRGPESVEDEPTPGAEPLDERALRVLALDLLGRPPYLAEWEAWLGRPRAEWVEAYVLGAGDGGGGNGGGTSGARGGEEFWRHWLESELYEMLLIDEFRPPRERIDGWVADLAAGRVGAREALHRVLLSTEFDRRNPGADTFVTVVMEELLDVTVQDSVRELENGKKLYDGGSGPFLGERGSSQADVVRIAVEDARTTRGLAARAHRRLLRAELEGRELARAGRALAEERGALPRLVAGWLVAPAWTERLARRRDVDNRRFVRGLYVDLLDRLPTDDETRRLRTALDGLADPRPLRSILVRSMLDSGRMPVPERLAEPGAFVVERFRRLLGRAPSAEERAIFLEVATTPEARPETLLLALLSHPEYQTW